MSTSPASVSRPQWPWSVYSSRQSSAMRTSESPTSSRRLRSATCTTPSGASAPEPRASLVVGHAEEDHRGDAEVGERPHLLAEALLGVLHDARHRRDRLRRVEPFLHEQRRDQVVDREPGFGHQPPQRGRAAQPAHAPRRGTSRRPGYPPQPLLARLTPRLSRGQPRQNGRGGWRRGRRWCAARLRRRRAGRVRPRWPR